MKLLKVMATIDGEPTEINTNAVTFVWDDGYEVELAATVNENLQILVTNPKPGTLPDRVYIENLPPPEAAE